MRIAGATVAVLWVVAAWLLWWTQVPAGLHVPHLDPHRFFSAAELRRNARYERFLRWDALAAIAAQVFALVLLSRWAGRLSRGPALVRAALLGGAAAGVAWLAALPFAAGSHWWNVRHGIARLSWGEWLVAQLPSFGARLVAGVAVATVFVALARALLSLPMTLSSRREPSARSIWSTGSCGRAEFIPPPWMTPCRA